MSKYKKLFVWTATGFFSDLMFATLFIVPFVDPDVSSVLWVLLMLFPLVFFARAAIFSTLQPQSLLKQNYFLAEAFIFAFMCAVLFFDVPYEWLFPAPYFLLAIASVMFFGIYWLCGKGGIKVFSSAAWIRFPIIAALAVSCLVVWMRLPYSSEVVVILTLAGIFIAASMILRLILFALYPCVKPQLRKLKLECIA